MRKNAGLITTKPPQPIAGSPAAGSARNSGIDLLRLISMLFVVILHVLHRGGALEASAKGTPQFMICVLFESVAYCAVDIFALISGYVIYSDERKPVRLSGYFQLWLQVAAYGVAVSLACLVLRPQWFSLSVLKRSALPITGDVYWYFTAYTGLFLLMPLLNTALRHTPERILRVFFAASIAVFSVYNMFFDRFKLEDGYSTLWLAIVYCMGGILKKCRIGARLKPWQAWAGIAALSLVSWAWQTFGVDAQDFVLPLRTVMLARYTSPTVLGCAILFVIAFSKMCFGRRMTRLIAVIAPCAFAVYLLNCHILVWDHVMLDRFRFLGTAAPYVTAGTIAGFALAFVILSVLIDLVRIALFRLLHIRQAADALERAVRRRLPDGRPHDENS